MDRRKQASGISGGIFLIGLGILMLTGWWWPGILVVIGLSGGAEQIFRGRTNSGIWTLAIFLGLALAFTLIQSTDVTWGIIGPFILIALGVIALVRVFYLKDDFEEEEAGVEATDLSQD
jgi:hypothetical protein